jgi:hypothetical protein
MINLLLLMSKSKRKAGGTKKKQSLAFTNYNVPHLTNRKKHTKMTRV